MSEANEERILNYPVKIKTHPHTAITPTSIFGLSKLAIWLNFRVSWMMYWKEQGAQYTVGTQLVFVE